MANERPIPSAMTVPDLLALMEEDAQAASSNTMVPVQASVLKTVFYNLPTGATMTQRTTVLTILTRFARSVDTTSSHWRSWLLTYLSIAYPEVAELSMKRNPSEYECRPLPPALVDEWVTSFKRVNESEDDATLEVVSSFAGFPELPELVIDTIITGCNELNGLYCYAALLVYLCGKSINAVNRVSVTTKRPRALMQEFQTQGSDYILSGDGRIGDRAHERINAAWTTLVDPRISIIEHFSQAMYEPTTAYRIVGHTMKLLRMNGMNYVGLAIRLLETCPFALTMPQLQSDLRAFKYSASKWATVNAHFRPFYKLALGNDCTLFRRKDMEGLVSVSIVLASTTTESLKNYRIAPGHSGLLTKFKALCAANGVDFNRSAEQAVVSHAL